MKKLIVGLLFVMTAGWLMVACNKSTSGDQPTDEFDRKALLMHVAEQIIVPAYAGFQSSFEEMQVAATAFVAAPDEEKLITLRTKWSAAYLRWQEVELFNFGPADQVLLRNYFNIYPTDVGLLQSYIASGTYNLELVSNNKVQGFPALDYLLNGSGNTTEEILNHYTNAGDAAAWKKYLTDVVTSMDGKIDQVSNAWNGDYKQQFINSDGTGAGSSLSLLVNEYIMNFERFIRSGKFGIPAGVMSGTPAPEKVEALYSPALGKELALTAVRASRDLFQGKAYQGGSSGPSLKSYLQALGQNNQNAATLAVNIDQQFGVIVDGISGLNGSIYEASISDRTSLLELYDEFQEQVRYLKVDMTSALGITISYTDNDGD